MKLFELHTERLVLRQWYQRDYPLFAKMNADLDVMEFYPDILTRQESDAMANKIETLISQRGWGFWALELKQNSRFIGFVGLHEPNYELPISPCIEMGWRLDKTAWGNGYATEAARKVLQFAFTELNLEQVFSFTSVNNFKSRAVMERLGLLNMKQNFEHPIIPEGHSLREHVLYKLNKLKWLKNNV